MANDRGLLQFDQLTDFVNFLTKRGIGSATPKGLWQARVIYLAEGSQVITYNSENVLSTPPALRRLIEEFHMGSQPGDPNDTQRLDFMLSKYRKVTIELIPDHSYEIYVEEGFMGDKRYPAVTLSPDGDLKATSPEVLAAKRQAIDLAIKNQ